MIVPKKLEIVVTGLGIGPVNKIGTISTRYEDGKAEIGENDTTKSSGAEYDEEVELYYNESSSKKPVQLEVFKVETENHSKIIFVSVPYTNDQLSVNLLAFNLILAINYHTLLGINIDNLLDGPYYLEHLFSKNRKYQIEFPKLTPPNFLTGSICSFVSKSVTLNKDTIVITTNDVLDSLNEVGRVLVQIFGIKDAKRYYASTSKNLSYGTSISGLYI